MNAKTTWMEERLTRVYVMYVSKERKKVPGIHERGIPITSLSRITADVT